MHTLKQEIDQLNLDIRERSNMPSMDKLKQQIQLFEDNWANMEIVQERNNLLKRIVDKKIYNREANNVYLGIQYN